MDHSRPTSRKVTRATSTWLWAFAALVLTISHARGVELLKLDIGSAHILRTPTKAGTVIIGNPKVAEVTTLNETTLAVTAKAEGHSAVLVLDPAGAEILSLDVLVGSAPSGVTIRLYKGVTHEVQEFRCSDGACQGPWTVSSPPRLPVEQAESSTPAIRWKGNNEVPEAPSESGRPKQ